MSKKFRNFLAILISVLGTVLALYVGVYRLIILNLISFVGTMHSGGLSTLFVVQAVVKILISMTLGGAIWVACDILASKIRGID